MPPVEIASLLRLHATSGERVRAALRCFPRLGLKATLSPITRTVLRVQLAVDPRWFEWHDRAHGNALRWWVWVEDASSENLLHAETWTLTKKVRACGDKVPRPQILRVGA
jgi:activating signal cointegrator complex subunit 3